LPDSGDKKKGLFRDMPRIPSTGSLMPFCLWNKKNLKLLTQAENRAHTVSVYSIPSSSAEPYDLVEFLLEAIYAIPEFKFG